MNSGKRFESKFHQSLKLLPGASFRLEDGGAVSKNKQLADYIYWDDGEETFAFECKATKKNAFPMCDIGNDQIRGLVEWEAMRTTFHSIVAINYYGENVAIDNRCILVEIRELLRYLEQTGRRSIPADDAARIGWECERIKGNIWKLDPWKVIQC